MSRFAKVKQENVQDLGDLDARYRLGKADEVEYEIKSKKGLTERLVRQISKRKSEPRWMLEMRLAALKRFEEMPIPKWGGDIGVIKFDEIHYYLRPKMEEAKSWEEVPKEVKATFEKIGVPQAEREYLAGVKSQFDCLAGDSKVFTCKGLKKIVDIELGEEVFALNEENGLLQGKKVLGVENKGLRKVFRVSTQGGREIRVTENHPFLKLDYTKTTPDRLRGRYKKEWHYLSDLRVGDLIALAIDFPEWGEAYKLPKIEKPRLEVDSKNQYGENKLNITNWYKKVKFPKRTSDDLMWLLGFYLGDGFLSGAKNYRGSRMRVDLAIPDNEVQLIEEVRKVVKKLFDYDLLTGKKDRVSLSSVLFVQMIEKLGFKGYAATKNIPGWVFGLPKSQRLSFIGGYFDADGGIREGKNNALVFTSASRKILEDLKLLAISCSLNPSHVWKFSSRIKYKGKNEYKHFDGYRVQLSGKIEEVGSRMDRKRNRFRERVFVHRFKSAKGTTFSNHVSNHIGFVKILEIKELGEEEVYDIEVEGSHNFVANGLIVHNSEVIYGSLKKVLAKKGVVFLSMDEGLKQYPDIVRKYFGTVVPLGDNKLAALNTAVWSGGSFVYVPEGVEVDLPLQAYFRINSENAGQFERTLIVVEEGAKVHYVEGCSAPAYTSGSLHAAVVEIVVKAGARCQYTTVQNWYKNVFNLVTKRAWVGEDGEMRWIDGNLGCIAESQKLITPDGVVKIEQIKVGQKVLSYDERKERLVFRRVLAKRNSGRQRVYDVSIGARKIRVTRNHPFYSYRYDSTRPKKLGRYELGFVRADELSKAIVPRTSLDYGKEYGLKKPKLRTEFWSGNQHKNGLRVAREQKSRLKIGDRTTDKLMWLFGYWLGDGDMSIKYGVNEKVVRWAKLGFSCPKDNRARERLMGIMSEVVEASPTERKDGVHVSWSSKELVELFVTNGFVGRAIDKRVPGWVWSLPEEQRVAFVSGCIDADGTVKEGRIDIKSVNKALLEDVASLLVTLGITSRLFTEFSESREVIIQGYNTVAHGSYRLSFEIDGRFERYIAGVLVDKIKQVSPKVKEQKRLVGRSGIKLGGDVEIARVKFEDVGKELPTWDIEVEGTGNFVCEGFIVHNSRLTMKYPACILAGKGAKGETLSIAWAGEGQHQDAGAKMIHLAPKTSSRIISKSISKGGGRASYRGMVQMSKGASGAKSKVVCDALILDDKSRSDTYPVNRIWENEVSLEHEATVSKVGEEQLFYLMSRGISEHDAEAMIVNGFLEPVMKEIPFEYAIEMNRLVNLEMEGSVG